MLHRPRHARGGLVALATVAGLVAALLPGPAAATAAPTLERNAPRADTAAVVRGGLTLQTFAACGAVRLLWDSDAADATLLGRLPLDVYVSEPSRGLARTFVTTVQSGNLGVDGISNSLCSSATSGRGPGLTVSLEWAGGTESITTEPYVDNCAGNFFAVTPTRLLDTRTGQGVANGLAGPVAANASIVIEPAASGAVPAIGITALVLNVTATDPATAGYLTVYPCGQEPPNTSNLNFAAGQTVPNLVVVDLVGFPPTGRVCVFASTATHVLADVTGYFLANGLATGSLLNSLAAPQRVLDTRGTRKITGGTVQRVPMAGGSGIPASGVTAVSMNITAVNAAAPGYLTAFPCDQPQPNASNVNYIAARAVPNAAIVGLSADGALCVYASQTTDVLIDVNGYTGATGDLYAPEIPTRLWDNRTSVFFGATAPRKLGPTGTFQYNTTLDPGTIVALNVTIIDAEAGGFATVYPCDQNLPNASNLNYQAGEAIANTVLVRVDASRSFCVFSTARVNFIIDRNGATL